MRKKNRNIELLLKQYLYMGIPKKHYDYQKIMKLSTPAAEIAK